VQKAVLAENIFGFDDETNPNALEICIHRVRKKLEGTGMAITTLRGLGYALRIDDGQ
jgi:two-component system, OmpR family, response regulator TctD